MEHDLAKARLAFYDKVDSNAHIYVHTQNLVSGPSCTGGLMGIMGRPRKLLEISRIPAEPPFTPIRSSFAFQSRNKPVRTELAFEVDHYASDACLISSTVFR